MGVDVEAAVVDACVLPLVEEVVELQFEVDVLQLEFGAGIAEPGMAVLGGQVIIVVLGSKSQREGLGGIDAHREALGVATHSSRLVAMPLGVATALTETAAIDNAHPFEGTERKTAAETKSLSVVLVEALTDESLAVGETVAAKGTDSGAQEVEALADLATQAVVAGYGGLVDGLNNTRCSLVTIAVDLIIMGAVIVKTNIGEECADGTAVAQRGVGPIVLGLRELFDI